VTYSGRVEEERTRILTSRNGVAVEKGIKIRADAPAFRGKFIKYSKNYSYIGTLTGGSRRKSLSLNRGRLEEVNGGESFVGRGGNREK